MTLKIKTSANSVRIKVRPRINWLLLFSALLVFLIIICVGLLPASARLEAAIHDGRGIGSPILSLLILSAMAIANMYGVVNMLFASEFVVLDRTTLEILKRLFSFKLSDRSFPNSTVENLRYDEWAAVERVCKMVFDSSAPVKRLHSRDKPPQPTLGTL
jgi:hypothetical protein